MVAGTIFWSQSAQSWRSEKRCLGVLNKTRSSERPHHLPAPSSEILLGCTWEREQTQNSFKKGVKNKWIFSCTIALLPLLAFRVQDWSVAPWCWFCNAGQWGEAMCSTSLGSTLSAFSVLLPYQALLSTPPALASRRCCCLKYAIHENILVFIFFFLVSVFLFYFKNHKKQD